MIVRASGGLVFRPGVAGPEVLLVHRPRYDDWSLPKGKDDPGENPAQAALREVGEETGVEAIIISELDEVRYTTSSGIDKRVKYFLMRPSGQIHWAPNPEVDDVRWLPVAEAIETLSYEHDRELVEACDLDPHVRSGTVYLVRHGSAGDRVAWEGDDRERPLTEKGRRQAAAIAAWLESQPIEAIVSSRHLRCRQTVAPLAEARGLPVHTHGALSEGSTERDIAGFARGLLGMTAVVCTHGDVIPAVLGFMATEGMDAPAEQRLEKGSVWVVAVAGGRFSSARYLPPLTS